MFFSYVYTISIVIFFYLRAAKIDKIFERNKDDCLKKIFFPDFDLLRVEGEIKWRKNNINILRLRKKALYLHPQFRYRHI